MYQLLYSIVISCLLLISSYINVTYADVQRKATPIIADFYGIWGNESPWREDTPFDRLNRIYVGFGKVLRGPDGHFILGFDGDEKRAKSIIKRVREINPQAEIFLFVGGNGNKDSFGGTHSDPKFPETVKSFLKKYGFNGFDIDWEQGLTKETLNGLVKNLYPVLHQAGYKLTLDVWHYVGYYYDMPVLRENLDQINIMSYGTGLNLQIIANWFISAGFPAYKIIGGIETESGFNQFGGVTDSLGDKGTIAQKANVVLQNHFAGLMSWRMDNDYTEQGSSSPTYKGAREMWKYMTRNIH